MLDAMSPARFSDDQKRQFFMLASLLGRLVGDPRTPSNLMWLANGLESEPMKTGVVLNDATPVAGALRRLIDHGGVPSQLTWIHEDLVHVHPRVSKGLALVAQGLADLSLAYRQAVFDTEPRYLPMPPPHEDPLLRATVLTQQRTTTRVSL